MLRLSKQNKHSLAMGKFRSIMECYPTEVHGVCVCVNSEDEDGAREVAELYFEMRHCNVNEDASDTPVNGSSSESGEDRTQ